MRLGRRWGVPLTRRAGARVIPVSNGGSSITDPGHGEPGSTASSLPTARPAAYHPFGLSHGPIDRGPAPTKTAACRALRGLPTRRTRPRPGRCSTDARQGRPSGGGTAVLPSEVRVEDLPAAGPLSCRQMFVRRDLGCSARAAAWLPAIPAASAERGLAFRTRRTADGFRFGFVARTSDRNYSPDSCPSGERSHWRTSREWCGREASRMRRCRVCYPNP